MVIRWDDSSLFFFTFNLLERGDEMELKDVITTIIIIAMVVVIGILMINMSELWMQENGIIQGFLEDIFDLVVEKVTEMMEFKGTV